MNIQYKAVGARSLTDEGNGIVSALVSVTGLKDNVNDVIEPGAYAKSLNKRTPKGVWHHSWTEPVAKTLEVVELMPGDSRLPTALPNGDTWPSQAGGLLVKMQFNLNTARGRDAYEDVKFFGDQQEWSIGYNVPSGSATVKSGVRHIKALELYEYSPVLFGAMSNARTTSVKSAQEAWASAVEMKGDEAEAFLLEMKSVLGEEIKGIREDEQHAPVEDDEDEDEFDDDEDWTEEDEFEEDEDEEKSQPFVAAYGAETIELAIKALQSVLDDADAALTGEQREQSSFVMASKSLAEMAEKAGLPDDLVAKAEEFDEAADFAIIPEMSVAGEPVMEFLEKALIDGTVDSDDIREMSLYIVDQYKEAGADVEAAEADGEEAVLDDDGSSVEGKAASVDGSSVAHGASSFEVKTIDLSDLDDILND